MRKGRLRGHVPTGLHPTDTERLAVKMLASSRRLSSKGDRSLHDLPEVNTLSLATRFLDGGRNRFIEIVQNAVANRRPNATNWYLIFADLTPGDRHRVSLDQVARAAGVQPDELLPELVANEMKYGQDVADLVKAALQPILAKQAGRSAKRIGGAYADIAQRDRMAILQSTGFFPAPKGTVVTVNANASATAQAAAIAAADPSMPSFLSDMTALGETRQDVQRQLATTPADLAPIDADFIADRVERS